MTEMSNFDSLSTGSGRQISEGDRSTNILSRSQLKCTIPKPYLGTISSRPRSVQLKKCDQASLPNSPSKPNLEVRPKTASVVSKNRYAHVKAKIDSRQTKLKDQVNPSGSGQVQSKDSCSNAGVGSIITSDECPSTKQIIEKQVTTTENQCKMAGKNKMKVRSKSELTSSIPKPTLLRRHPQRDVSVPSTISMQSQPVIRHQIQWSQPSTQDVRPKTVAVGCRNRYAHVKAKINSKRTPQTKLERECNRSDFSEAQHQEFCTTKTNTKSLCLTSLGNECTVPEKHSNHKVWSKFELKSTIPAPDLKYKIQSADHEKTFDTVHPRRSRLHNQNCQGQKKRDHTSLPSSPARLGHEVRPKTASTVEKNAYSPILPPQSKLKSHDNLKDCGHTQGNECSSSAVVETKQLHGDGTADVLPGEKPLTSEEALGNQRQLLSLYTDLQSLQSFEDLQLLDHEISPMIENNFDYFEGLSRNSSFILSNDGPEFLVRFDGQMQTVKELWLRLLCDVGTKISTQQHTEGLHSVISHLPLANTTQDLRDEVYKLLSNISSEGDQLQIKLEKIEEYTLSAIAKMVPVVLALCKDYEDLKHNYSTLEKVQEDIHNELKEELLILNEENNELDQKYAIAAQNLDFEKKRNEQLEKHRLTIQKDLLETKKILKLTEEKCSDLDDKLKKMDTSCRSVEGALRNTNMQLGKEKKLQKELINKMNAIEKLNKNIQQELEDERLARMNLEASNETLQQQLNTNKASLDDTLQKQTELMEELHKYKTHSTIETELDEHGLTQHIHENKHIENSTQIKKLSNDIQQRDLKIEELNNKVHQMEIVIAEKLEKEETLTHEVSSHKTEPSENEGTMKLQIKELQYAVKTLMEENAELDQIVAQKSLELEQRDLLMAQHSKISQVKELLPLLCNKEKKDKEVVEKLSAVFYEQRKPYIEEIKEDDKDGKQSLNEAIKALEQTVSYLDPELVDKELSFRKQKMEEQYNLLEQKQIKIMKLERRLKNLERSSHSQGPVSSILGRDKPNKPKGLFSLFSWGQEDIPDN